jgi:hypothetical protein
MTGPGRGPCELGDRPVRGIHAPGPTRAAADRAVADRFPTRALTPGRSFASQGARRDPDTPSSGSSSTAGQGTAARGARTTRSCRFSGGSSTPGQRRTGRSPSAAARGGSRGAACGVPRGSRMRRHVSAPRSWGWAGTRARPAWQRWPGRPTCVFEWAISGSSTTSTTGGDSWSFCALPGAPRARVVGSAEEFRAGGAACSASECAQPASAGGRSACHAGSA